MNIATARKYRKRSGPLGALLVKNPVLVLGLDLPFIIVCGTALKTAVALSIEMFVIHMVTIAVSMVTVRYLPMWARMAVNIGTAFITMTFARQLVTHIFPELSNYVGMYIYLMAVNGITVYQSFRITRRDKLWPVMSTGLFDCASFTVTMLLVSLVREYIAGGTLWGIPLNPPLRLSALALPFGGFVFMGFLLAFVRFVSKQVLAFSIAESMRRDARYMPIKRRGKADLQDPFDADIE